MYTTGSGSMSSSSTTGLSLTVANPAVILNNIAQRYESLTRVLMEYIDNAIDDREFEFRQNNYSYDRPVDIRITLNSRERTVRITDNSSGLDKEQLAQVMLTAGESKKKGVPWLNGQFGFGIHAFRAAAQSIRIESKKDGNPLVSVSLNRDQATNIDPPIEISEADTPIECSGTNVYISSIDMEWLRGLNIHVISDEIQYHFERLLSRPNLSICVEEIQDNVIIQRQCAPFHYENIAGQEFKRSFIVNNHPVSVHLKVTNQEYAGRTPRFFSLGRRINEISKVQSFTKLSFHKGAIWSNPLIIGYIDVTDAVETVITRDEFKTGKERRMLYDHLLEMESSIKNALDKELEKHMVKDMKQYGDKLSKAFYEIMLNEEKVKRKLARQKERTRLRLDGTLIQPLRISPDVDADDESDYLAERQKEDNQTLKKKEPRKKEMDKLGKDRSKPDMIQFQFVEIPAPDVGEMQRSVMVDNQVNINTLHPDYVSRLGVGKGRKKVTDRTSTYLAYIVAMHYHDREYSKKGITPDHSVLMKDVLDTSTMFDDYLRLNLRIKSPSEPKGKPVKDDSNTNNILEVVRRKD
eukprot:CFRG2206T1